MEEKRYYYKDKQGNHYNYKSEHTEEYLIPITKEEFNELTKPPEPTAEQKALIEKARQIAELKKKLADTDYIVLKIAEAQADGETETIEALKITYVTELANRKAWREQINELEG